MIDAMTDYPASYRDLLDAQVLTLATLEPDNQPQLSEVWFLHDDGELQISLNSSRRKTHNLEQRPECSVLLLDVQNPYRYLEVRGRARLEADPDGAIASKVGSKYGADLQEYDQPGDTRFVLTVEPKKVHAVDMS